MTQFQQSASVRTLDTSERAYPAPFLAIAAGFVTVLIALALISFAVDARPSETALNGNADTTAVDGYLAGLIAAQSAPRVESAQRLADQWAAAATVSRHQSLQGGWEAAQIRHGQAMRDYVKRVPTAE